MYVLYFVTYLAYGNATFLDRAVIINLTRKREEGIGFGEEGIRKERREREIREGFGFDVFRRFSPYCILTFRSEGAVAKTHQLIKVFINCVPVPQIPL
jgi:hypothetical protein